MTNLSTQIRRRTRCDGAPARRVLRKGLALGGLAALLCLSAQGALYTFSGPFQNGGVIPDNSTIGLTDAHTLSGLTGYIRLGNLASSPFVNLDQYLTDGTTSFSVDLASLRSLDPNNTWTLFFADTSPGIENSLVSWSLDITAVPEPMEWALIIFFGLFAGLRGFCFIRRTRFGSGLAGTKS